MPMCIDCGGSGKYVMSDGVTAAIERPCPICGGSGQVSGKRFGRAILILSFFFLFMCIACVVVGKMVHAF